MTYRQVFTPDKENHSIEVPEQFFGKEIKVIIEDVDNSTKLTHPVPPKGKKVNIEELLEGFGTMPDFPSIEEIRAKAWPSKW